MAELLNQCLTGGGVSHTQDLMREMAELPHNVDKDPYILALEYFSPIYMMMNIFDSMEDKAAAIKMVERHIGTDF
jgi:hypothetical protein